MKDLIPLSVPVIKGNEWKYVKDCLDTGWVSSVGAYVDRFEEQMAKLAGRKYAIACVNGTSALHMAFLVAGIKADEEIVMPTLTFAAPAFAARYIGAWPVFIDVEPDHWQMDINKLSEFLEKECRYTGGRLVNRHTKRTVRAILAVHVLGHPVDMDELLGLSRKYGLLVIEDVAESIGAKYHQQSTGSFGDLACFSFNGNKVITCGGGGMIVTDDKKMAQRIKHLTTQAKSDPIEYLHDEIGFNYRMTNVQAAIGLAQLENLDEYIVLKKKIAGIYDRHLKKIKGLSLPQQAPGAESIWWLYTVLVDKAVFGKDSRALMKSLAVAGIQSRPLWCPLYKLAPFKDCYAFKIAVVDRLYEQALSLPSSVNLSAEDLQRVIKAIK